MTRLSWAACLAVACLLLPARAGATEADMELYKKAMAFLIAQQHEGGGWGPEAPGELGITSLVIKGIADAPAEIRAEYLPKAEAAMAWVLKSQGEDGSITVDRTGLTTYRTAIAIMAMKSLDAERYAEPIKKAAQWLIGDQFTQEDGVAPDDPHYGGYGYGHDGEKPDADLSNTHIAMAALHDAGIAPDDPVFQRAMEFITRCQNSSETNPGVGKLRPLDDGGFIYDPGLSRNKSSAVEHEDGTTSFVSYASMTYAGLMAMIYSDLQPDDPRMQAALGWIANNYTLEENKGLGVRAEDPNAAQQGLYYYYHTFAKALAQRGEPTLETSEGTRHWARDLFDALHARVKEGGFFRNENSRWWEQDPTLVTAYVINAMNYAIPFLPE